MTKLINCVLILVILCGGLHLSVGETLKCEFIDANYHLIGSLYTCKVTSLDNSFNNMRIDGYTGTHTLNKNDNDVKAIWITGTNMKYIPEGLGSLSNLLALIIASSQLVEIKDNDFVGMRNLEFLNLYNNKLTSVPSNVFSTLTKLKVIFLHYNQIKEISSELFSNNLNLEYVDFDDNKIRYIGSELFNGLIQLKQVYLRNNICVNKFYNGTTISDLKQEIKMNCDKANDVIQYEIENKILKEFEGLKKKSEEIENKILKELRDESKKTNEKNQMEFEVLKKKSDETERKIEVLNEMMKQLLKICQERQEVRF